MAALEGWQLVRTMLDDMVAMVEQDAEDERERLEGLRALGRITALCSELSLDVDVDAPWFFDMNTPARYVGGPNPDGNYALAMIDGSRRYRVTGSRDPAVADEGGRVRVVIAGDDPGTPTWLDTDGRRRGFVVLRWLDNPEPPVVATKVVG